MHARAAVVDDSAWIAAALNRRREPLVQHAPVFWRSAPDAVSRHRAFLDQLLRDSGAMAYRTDDSVLVAARRADGWLVDDFFVDQESWTRDGRDLWNAFWPRLSGRPRAVRVSGLRARPRSLRPAGETDITASWW
jgi:hypothetical protein